MIKNVLIAFSIFIGTTCFSQFTQSNEPNVGDEIILYLIDSLAPDFETTTGASVSWDYSSYGGYDGEARTVSVLEPISTSYQSEFLTSSDVIDIQGFLKNFYSSTTSERNCQGYVYEDNQLGEVILKFSSDEALQYEYPFDLNDTLIDSFEGTATYNLGGTQSSPVTGESTITVDGQGELILADGVSYSNITRYKTSEVIEISTAIGTWIMERIQYEYYDLDNQRLPVFLHTYVNITSGGTSVDEFSLVLSSEDPEYVLGLEKSIILSETKVYPNPASHVINIELPENIETSKISITDEVGREVYKGIINESNEKVDVSSLNEGIYFVTISNGELTATKKVMIN